MLGLVSLDREPEVRGQEGATKMGYVSLSTWELLSICPFRLPQHFVMPSLQGGRLPAFWGPRASGGLSPHLWGSLGLVCSFLLKLCPSQAQSLPSAPKSDTQHLSEPEFTQENLGSQRMRA